MQAATLDEAAESLRSWFTDRLTVDPGTPGPFGGLVYDLVAASLELVDWHELAAGIRGD